MRGGWSLGSEGTTAGRDVAVHSGIQTGPFRERLAMNHPDKPNSDAAAALAVRAAAALADARRELESPSQPGARDRHRALLERAIELAQAALATANAADQARATLLSAHAARADNARYGAGQLARGAQRAPTREDCDDGWRRVEAIVRDAEASARAASQLASAAATPAARKAAAYADRAAREARRLVVERNNAYTFHADPRFSFGEGWYVTAAALLDGIDVQLDRSEPLALQAEQFLRDAGVATRLVEYRSRPRANKHLTSIVASAFRRDPAAAQRRVREAFLGPAPVPPAIVDWTARALADAPPDPKVLLWIRHSGHHPARNTTYAELAELVELAAHHQLVPILFGDAVRGGPPLPGAIDLALRWRDPEFQGLNMRRAQLQLFEQLRLAHRLVGQVGVTTAGMDGPALLGVPTLYLTAETNVRMRAWVGAIPSYQEVVRDGHHLARVGAAFARWRSA